MISHIRLGLILLLLAFLLLRFSHPYVVSYEFQRLVEQEVETVRPHAESGNIHQRILDQGRSMGLRIAADDILVQRLVRGYQVQVKYAVPLDLLVYKTEVKFDTSARTASSELQ